MPPSCTHAPSAARLFVQLSAGARLPNSILEVFLPLLQARTARTCRTHASARATTPSQPAMPLRPQYFPAPKFQVGRNHGIAVAAPPRRAFSSTVAQRKTLAIHNPQVDEAGEMMVELTPRAANRLTKIMTKDSNPNLALRIQVEAGGCHGFQYLMKLVTLPAARPKSEPSNSNLDHSTSSSSPPPSAEAEAELAPSTTTSTQPAVSELKEDDTIFTFVKDDAPPEQVADKKALAAGPKIVLDTTSLDLLKGSKLDFTMELIGSQFKIIDNPAASSSCGCGTSFDIKL